LKSSKAYEKGKNIPVDCFRKVTDMQYQCKSQQEENNEDVWYDLDMQTQICLCAQGIQWKLC
jgi:hypothetical protein